MAARTNHLIVRDAAGAAHDTLYAVAPGTSPSVEGLMASPSRGFRVAFQEASTRTLWLLGNDLAGHNTRLGMAWGSPQCLLLLGSLTLVHVGASPFSSRWHVQSAMEIP